MNKGLTLIETLVGVAVFVLIAVSVWQGFIKLLEGVNVLRVKNAATTLANELFEITRNMPYGDVGIVNGLPPGKISKTQIFERDGKRFEVEASVLWVDDPFDGQIGEIPDDLSPIDNKLVQFTIKCLNCKNIDDFVVVSKITPRNLEATGDMGALFVEVVDADGDPVSLANIRIENNQSTSTILIEEKTNNSGMFQLVGAPPGIEAYEIIVSKNGYTSERTYKTGEITNPVPIKPHANVSIGLVTLITFIIDKISSVQINTLSSSCSSISSVDFNFLGTKTIGENILKHSLDLISDSSGSVFLNNVEWDSYNIDIDDGSYFLAGSNPMLPFVINPDSNQKLDLILEPQRPNALLVNVINRNSNLPISDAEITLEKLGASKTKYTGRGALSQIDWQGGAGQEIIGDDNKYFSQDGNIDDFSAGEIKLLNSSGVYSFSGSLISSIFDTGTTTNFHIFNWEPQGQPAEVGSKPIKFQIATNEILTSTTTWEFIGPDGTHSSFFEVSGEPFSEVSNGDRYLRYKAILSTENTNYSPNLSGISFSFSTGCAPSGQAYFDNLDSGTYRITITKEGFQDYVLDNLSIINSWQSLDVIMDHI